MKTPRRAAPTETEDRHRDRWLISYADLVTLLLGLFIVMYGASDYDRARRIAESFSAENSGGRGILNGSESQSDARAKFQTTLAENPVLMQKAKIRETKSGTVVSLSEAGVFAPGDATIGPEAQAIIKTLADNLAGTDFQVRVEGHTDSVPISNAKYSSNWELSTARAANVLQLLVDFGIGPERLSAAGYGGFQPLADNATPEGRAQNRRVDIVILNP
ncbi:MAG: OmpA family protein [Acidobacteria bacterium]|nr:OmpA family protein [Acidobacteriota bacterium]